jgi:hypothetical protein
MKMGAVDRQGADTSAISLDDLRPSPPRTDLREFAIYDLGICFNSGRIAANIAKLPELLKRPHPNDALFLF